MITGPPSSGKTFYGEKLLKYFNIPHILINDVITCNKTLTDKLDEEIKQKMKKLKIILKKKLKHIKREQIEKNLFTN